MKYCPSCMLMLSTDAFYSYDYLTTSDGYSNYCKDCLRKNQKQIDKLRRKDPTKREKLLASKRRYREANRARINEQARMVYSESKKVG